MEKTQVSRLFYKIFGGTKIENENQIAGGAGPTSALKDKPNRKYPADKDEYEVTMNSPSDNDKSITLL